MHAFNVLQSIAAAGLAIGHACAEDTASTQMHIRLTWSLVAQARPNLTFSKFLGGSAVNTSSTAGVPAF